MRPLSALLCMPGVEQGEERRRWRKKVGPASMFCRMRVNGPGLGDPNWTF